MSALDLLVDGFPHGTVDGFSLGCKGANCPALMACRDVHMRYSGDYGFRKAIDSGMTLEAVLAAGAERERLQAEAAVHARRAEREVSRRKPIVAVPEHGTEAGYQAGCFTLSCPSTPSCADVHLGITVRRESRAPRELKGRVTQPHGTNAGFARGCRTQDDCPNVEAGGISCLDAHRQYHREYSAARASREDAAAGHHGSVYGNRLGCKSRETCPAGAGHTCADVALAADVAHRRSQGIGPAPELVPAQPIIEHVARLRAAGVPVMGSRGIVAMSGLPKSTIKNLVWGRSPSRNSAGPPELVTKATAEKLLAVTA